MTARAALARLIPALRSGPGRGHPESVDGRLHEDVEDTLAEMEREFAPTGLAGRLASLPGLLWDWLGTPEWTVSLVLPWPERYCELACVVLASAEVLVVTLLMALVVPLPLPHWDRIAVVFIVPLAVWKIAGIQAFPRPSTAPERVEEER